MEWLFPVVGPIVMPCYQISIELLGNIIYLGCVWKIFMIHSFPHYIFCSIQTHEGIIMSCGFVEFNHHWHHTDSKPLPKNNLECKYSFMFLKINSPLQRLPYSPHSWHEQNAAVQFFKFHLPWHQAISQLSPTATWQPVCFIGVQMQRDDSSI